jgi:hypothetical protein
MNNINTNINDYLIVILIHFITIIASFLIVTN